MHSFFAKFMIICILGHGKQLSGVTKLAKHLKVIVVLNSGQKFLLSENFLFLVVILDRAMPKIEVLIRKKAESN